MFQKKARPQWRATFQKFVGGVLIALVVCFFSQFSVVAPSRKMFFSRSHQGFVLAYLFIGVATLVHRTFFPAEECTRLCEWFFSNSAKRRINGDIQNSDRNSCSDSHRLPVEIQHERNWFQWLLAPLFIFAQFFPRFVHLQRVARCFSVKGWGVLHPKPTSASPWNRSCSAIHE